MKKRSNFDQMITEALQEETESVFAREELKEAIDYRIEEAKKSTIKTRRLFPKKRMLVLAAVLCVVMASTAFVFATGRVTTLISVAGPGYRSSSFADLEKAESKLGYSIDVIEKFSNGYQFYKMYVEGVKGIDEKGHQAGTYKEFSILYKRGEESLNFSASQPFAEERGKGSGVKTTREKEGIAFWLREDTYKFVPENYELTEKDQENLKRDDYFISVGNDKIEEETVYSVRWEKGGVSYYLGSYHWNDDGEVLIDMAEEIAFVQKE